MSNISLSTMETIMLYALSKNKTMLMIMINNLTKQQKDVLHKACNFILKFI
jgi:hypothetical protein